MPFSSQDTLCQGPHRLLLLGLEKKCVEKKKKKRQIIKCYFSGRFYIRIYILLPVLFFGSLFPPHNKNKEVIATFICEFISCNFGLKF